MVRRNMGGYWSLTAVQAPTLAQSLMGSILAVSFRHVRFFVIAIVDQHTVIKLDRFSRRDRVAAILVRVAEEVLKAKGIRG